jgi:hypothetical protein
MLPHEADMILLTPMCPHIQRQVERVYPCERYLLMPDKAFPNAPQPALCKLVMQTPRFVSLIDRSSVLSDCAQDRSFE